MSPSTLKDVSALAEQANAFFMRGDMENAIKVWRKALAILPHIPEILANMALALYRLRRYEEAESAIADALKLKPDYPEALNTLGNLRQQASRHDEALAAWRKAIALKPAYLSPHINTGKLLRKMKDDAGAAAAYEAALALAPDHADLLAELLYRLHSLCRWEKVGELSSRLEQSLQTTPHCASPFATMLYTPPALQRENAIRWSRQYYPGDKAYDAARSISPDGKLRIGYLSSDFYQHATAHLISELFERHDRGQFTIYAYSAGGRPGPELERIRRSVDTFRDITALHSRAAAALIEQDHIDILVDLKGYTQNHRLDVPALRPAPIQMHYLGYPGTTGTPFIDYFIADGTAAPPGMEAHFTEALIRLPHSYQINDRRRPLPAHAKSRAEYALPEQGFVFCAFNQTYKITPQLFDSWMRLLKVVEGSVLWLYEGGAEATANLKREAEKRGVDGARLVMAEHLALAGHLARYRHADLFLDTSPVCGHTTASDALWCAVPVVTLAGESFAGRVAASLLSAVGLPELVTDSLQAYEALALSLANDSPKRARYKEHLEKGRMAFPLFDSAATTKALEAAYRQAARRHRQAQLPRHFSITADMSIV